MQQQADENELGLSSAALEALKEFALENNILFGPEGGDGDAIDLRRQIQDRMDVKERTRDFCFTFGDDGDGEQVCIALTGVNPELGQTLASTGLTVWRAAEEMTRFMWEHRRWFVGKHVVELGAGLGLCGVLASKLCTGGKVVITDGGEEFTNSAMDALRANLVKNSCNLLVAPPARASDDGKAGRGCAEAGGSGVGAQVVLEKLTWGEHAGFLRRHCGHRSILDGGDDENQEGVRQQGGFDFIIAADVIYEEEGVSPLLHTVVDILRLREDDCTNDKHPDHVHSHGLLPAEEVPTREGQQQQERLMSHVESGGTGSTLVLAQPALLSPPPSSLSPAPAVPTFLLAFARRNISIDRVLEEAESLGLAWRVPDDFEPESASENIYLMNLR